MLKRTKVQPRDDAKKEHPPQGDGSSSPILSSFTGFSYEEGIPEPEEGIPEPEEDMPEEESLSTDIRLLALQYLDDDAQLQDASTTIQSILGELEQLKFKYIDSRYAEMQLIAYQVWIYFHNEVQPNKFESCLNELLSIIDDIIYDQSATVGKPLFYRALVEIIFKQNSVDANTARFQALHTKYLATEIERLAIKYKETAEKRTPLRTFLRTVGKKKQAALDTLKPSIQPQSNPDSPAPTTSVKKKRKKPRRKDGGKGKNHPKTAKPSPSSKITEEKEVGDQIVPGGSEDKQAETPSLSEALKATAHQLNTALQELKGGEITAENIEKFEPLYKQVQVINQSNVLKKMDDKVAANAIRATLMHVAIKLGAFYRAQGEIATAIKYIQSAQGRADSLQQVDLSADLSAQIIELNAMKVSKAMKQKSDSDATASVSASASAPSLPEVKTEQEPPQASAKDDAQLIPAGAKKKKGRKSKKNKTKREEATNPAPSAPIPIPAPAPVSVPAAVIDDPFNKEITAEELLELFDPLKDQKKIAAIKRNFDINKNLNFLLKDVKLSEPESKLQNLLFQKGLTVLEFALLMHSPRLLTQGIAKDNDAEIKLPSELRTRGPISNNDTVKKIIVMLTDAKLPDDQRFVVSKQDFNYIQFKLANPQAGDNEITLTWDENTSNSNPFPQTSCIFQYCTSPDGSKDSAKLEPNNPEKRQAFKQALDKKEFNYEYRLDRNLEQRSALRIVKYYERFKDAKLLTFYGHYYENSSQVPEIKVMSPVLLREWYKRNPEVFTKRFCNLEDINILLRKGHHHSEIAMPFIEGCCRKSLVEKDQEDAIKQPRNGKALFADEELLTTAVEQMIKFLKIWADEDGNNSDLRNYMSILKQNYTLLLDPDCYPEKITKPNIVPSPIPTRGIYTPEDHFGSPESLPRFRPASAQQPERRLSSQHRKGLSTPPAYPPSPQSPEFWGKGDMRARRSFPTLPSPPPSYNHSPNPFSYLQPSPSPTASPSPPPPRPMHLPHHSVFPQPHQASFLSAAGAGEQAYYIGQQYGYSSGYSPSSPPTPPPVTRRSPQPMTGVPQQRMSGIHQPVPLQFWDSPNYAAPTANPGGGRAARQHRRGQGK